MNKKNKKCLNKVKKFCQETKQGPCFIGIGTFMSAVTGYSNKKNITFLLQNYSVR